MSSAQKSHSAQLETAVTSPIETIEPSPQSPSSETTRQFISLRWRILMPIAVAAMILSMVGAYLVSYSLVGELDEQDLLEVRDNSDSVAEAFTELGVLHQQELFRMSNTGGVRENIITQNATRLQSLIEPNALLADLDFLVITDATGKEIIALQQIQFSDGRIDYVVLERSSVSSIPFLSKVLFEDSSTLSNLITLEDDFYIISAIAITDENNAVIGSISVGTKIDKFLKSVEKSEQFSLGIYDMLGRPLIANPISDRVITAGITQQISETPEQTIIETQIINGSRYHVAYIPLVVNQSLLGVVSVSQLTTTAAANTTRHVIGLSAALVMAGVVTIGYRVIAKHVQRIEIIRDTALALASGNQKARSNIKTSDEIGELASALDRYADVVEHRMTTLTRHLQNQRREANRLQTILESISDGLIILDPSGRILMTNSAAKQLLGHSETINLTQLLDTITDTLGPLIAPNIHTVGEPTRIAHNGKILQAQAATVLNDSRKRLGMLVTLRDISEDVRREQRYEQLLEELSQEVQLPISYAAQDAAIAAAEQNAEPTTLLNFAREVARNARSLQRIIGELRDLQTFSPEDVERVQQPILVSDLLWQLAAQWKPIAQAAHQTLNVHIPDKNYYILGDHRRLQWAIGNLIDNAIKYGLDGNVITLQSEEVQDGQTAHFTLRDQGLGIAKDELPHVFKRFFRGHPQKLDGTLVHQPGTGQGLYLTKRVIEAHDGEIAIESIIGEGTTVHIWLPLTAEITFPYMPKYFATSATTQKENTREYSLIPRVLKQLANKRKH